MCQDASVDRMGLSGHLSIAELGPDEFQRV